MVVDVLKTTNKNLRKINPQSINDIYNHNGLIVDFSNKMKEIDNILNQIIDLFLN